MASNLYRLTKRVDAPGSAAFIFTIVDETGVPLTGKSEDISVEVYDVSGNSVPVAANVVEGSSGVYSARFDLTSAMSGHLLVKITCPDTSLDYLCEVFADTSLLKILGLEHENQYIDQIVYHPYFKKMTSARLRIYDSPENVGTDSGVLATYSISATYDIGSGLMTSYSAKLNL